MHAKRVATLVAGLLIAHSLPLAAREADILSRILRAVGTVAPSGTVEIDRHDPAHATCRVGAGRVELAVGERGGLTMTAVVRERGAGREALLRRVSDINDRLDVGTLGWNGRGELVLTHTISRLEGDPEETARIVVRMAVLSGQIAGVLGSIARS